MENGKILIGLQFSKAFYQANWDWLKGDLLRVFQQFWNDGVVNRFIKRTYICLIPKKILSSKVLDYRPISLVSSLYKVISEVLAERLKDVLEEMVAEVQGAFVAERQIVDLVLIANEAVEDYRSSKKKGIVFKIDFEKAYDRVEWSFLDFVIEKKGFGSS